MPPKRKTKSAAVRPPTPPMDDLLPGGGDGPDPPSLPRAFHEAVGHLVERVRNVLDSNVTMFKLEMANVLAGQRPSDVLSALSAKARQDIFVVEPLCEVRPEDLPDNGCSVLFDQRQYAEALLHATRAHFAFVEFDRRLIYTSTAGLRDPDSATQLLYLFSYLKTPADRAEPAIVRTMASQLGRRETTNRRRTLAVVPPEPMDEDTYGSSIGEELEKYRDKLDQVERSLLETSQSLQEDLRLPEAVLDSSLDDVPTPQLGAALHAVLPRVQAAVAAGPLAARRKTSGVLPPKAAAATSRRGEPQSKRRRSMSPTDTAVDSSAGAPSPLPEAQLPSRPAPTTPSKSRQSTAAVAASEADHLVTFYQRLNGAQSEQSRVSLTCRYAKMRYGHDVSAGAVYRLLEAARRQQGRDAPPPPPPPAAPPLLSEDGRRQTALAVFSELDSKQSEQSRVAYTLQYMRVQHAAKIDANTLFGWLGQGAKRPAAKKAKAR